MKTPQIIEKFLKGKKGEMQAWVIGGIMAFLVAAVLLYMISPILYNVENGVPDMSGSWNTTATSTATSIQGAVGMLTVVLIIVVVVIIIGTLLFLQRKTK